MWSPSQADILYLFLDIKVATNLPDWETQPPNDVLPLQNNWNLQPPAVLVVPAPVSEDWVDSQRIWPSWTTFLYWAFHKTGNLPFIATPWTTYKPLQCLCPDKQLPIFTDEVNMLPVKSFWTQFRWYQAPTPQSSRSQWRQLHYYGNFMIILDLQAGIDLGCDSAIFSHSCLRYSFNIHSAQ